MADRAPRIVDRDFARDTEQLLESYTGAAAPEGADTGMRHAIVQVFAHLAEIVAERINGMAQKNLLAFLDTIGVVPRAAAPARVALTFRLAPGTAGGAVVPARTQVAAAPAEGESVPVLFETERELFAVAARLAAIGVRDPLGDRWALAPVDGSASFATFAGDRDNAHRIYLSSDVLATDVPKRVVVDFGDEARQRTWTAALRWECWDGGGWASVDVDLESTPGSTVLADVPAVPGSEVAGHAGRWLRATLATSLPRTSPGDDRIEQAGAAFDAAVASWDGHVVTPDLATAFRPFLEVEPGACFAIAWQEAFSKPGAVVSLRIDATAPESGRQDMRVLWQYSAADGWRELAPQASADADPTQPTRAFIADGTVSFACPPSWAAQPLDGVRGLWLRATIIEAAWTASEPPTITLAGAYEWALPAVRDVRVAVEMAESGLRPDAAFANRTPIDLNVDFHPFGEQPGLNAVFYLRSDQGFARSRKALRLDVEVTNADTPEGNPPPAQSSADLSLVWECWSTELRAWAELAATDTTENLTVHGAVVLDLPETFGPVEVNGITAHWIRARIRRGDYGRPARYTLIDIAPADAERVAAAVVEPETFAPPVIRSLTLQYTTAGDAPSAPTVLCENALELVDRTDAATRGAEILRPFVAMRLARPTLYLGFDQPLPDRATSLYLALEQVRWSAATAGAATGDLAPPVVVWEYWNADELRWARLAARDETRSFTRPGLVTFVAPPAHAPSSEFGTTLRWIRARWERGQYAVAPRAASILPNTTWAVNAITSNEEVLGSATSQPNQAMAFAGRPVLEGEVVEVFESTGGSKHAWVRWAAVRDFYESGPRDRHYVVERDAATVRFGDGRNGMAPPTGRNNVRAGYRFGGGASGNRPAGTITQLKSAVPYVQAVANPEPARGGAARETPDDAAERGPRTLRHGGRAITADDIRDLASETSVEVARVLTLPAGPNTAGRVGLVVVARVPGARMPVPSLALLDQVQEYVIQRATPTFDIWVAGPGWIEVTVRAEVVPRDLDEAARTEGDVLNAIDAFLHPLTGGADGDGWPFGRVPHRSDLVARIEAVAGVDHVRAVSVATRTEQEPPARGATLVFAGVHDIAMVAGD